MKKLKKLLVVFLAVAALAICSLCFAACGSSNSAVGTWKFSSMTTTAEGVTIDVKAGESYMGITLSEDYLVIEIKDDGTWVLTTTMMGESDTQEGTWTQDGKTISFVSDGKTQNGTIDGDELTLSSGDDFGADMTLVFTRK